MDARDRFRRAESWVIYRLVVDGAVTGPTGVCEQDEWEAMEREQPGGTFVVQSGIADERVAERLAQGTSDGPVIRARHRFRVTEIPATQQEAVWDS